MNKIILIGNGPNGSIFCRIKFDGGRLSISGVEGPDPNGNCRGGCGQIVMHDWHIHAYAEGWDAAKVAHFREVWKRWHLNDLRAGSPAQEQYLREHPVSVSYPEAPYQKASAVLEAAGLNPDPETGYRYGRAWHLEAVPQSIIDYLEGLPVSPVAPAWC